MVKIKITLHFRARYLVEQVLRIRIKGMDICTEKERMIMKMFGINLEEPSGGMIEEDEPGVLNKEYKK